MMNHLLQMMISDYMEYELSVNVSPSDRLVDMFNELIDTNNNGHKYESLRRQF